MAKMVARFPGTCRECGRKFAAGAEIDWTKGAGAACAKCFSSKADADEQAVGLVPGGAQHKTAKRNRKADHCRDCGTWIPAGEGELVFCLEDSGCLEHHDHSGYHVVCLDPAKCKTQRAENIASKKAEVEKQKAAGLVKLAAAQKAESDGLAALAEATAGLVKTTCKIALEGKGEALGSFKQGCYNTTLSRYGSVVVLESYGMDDFRQYFYAPESAVDAAVLAWAGKVGLTLEAAQGWLGKYNGCEGADDYRRFVKLHG